MRRVVFPIALLACLLAPVAAQASGRSVVRDCTDNGRIDSYHSQADYQSALKHLPSDVNEYTDCRQIIEQAKRKDARTGPPSSGGASGGGVGGGGVSGGGFGGFDASTLPPASNVPAGPSAAESAALAQAAKAGGAAVPVAGEPITPGGSGLTEAAFRHDVPAPLLALVILLGLGALAATVSGARARGVHAPSSVLRVFDRVFPRRA